MESTRLDLRFDPAMPPAGLIAIPGTEVMWTEAAIAIARMIRNAPATAHVRMDYSQLPVIEKRNWFVEEFLTHQEWGWLLFLDSDMVPPATLVEERSPLAWSPAESSTR